MRRCYKCGIEKDLSAFPKHKGKPENRGYKCKLCCVESSRKYREENADELKERRKPFLEKYIENKYKRLYGITLEQYQEMYEAQNGLCAICGQPETCKTNTGKIANLSIDHDHDTGEVRGLLCRNCNHGLGCFKDNKESLRNAITYLGEI